MDFPFAQITIQQMIIFLQVVEHGGFAKSSKYLNMTQSAISKSIAKLEKELGITLFQRTTRELHLTPAGHSLYESWNVITAHIRDSYLKASLLQNDKDKLLRIGILTTARPELYFWQIQDSFQKNHPDIQIELRTAYITELVHDLHQGEYDLVMIPDFERFRLADLNLCWKWAACSNVQIILRKDHPLAKYSKLSTADILYEKFATLKHPSGRQSHRADLEERFARYHVEPTFGDTYQSAYDLKLLFRNSKDTLLVTDDYFDYPQDESLVKIPLTDQTNGIICAWNPSVLNEAGQYFLDELRPVHND